MFTKYKNLKTLLELSVLNLNAGEKAITEITTSQETLNVVKTSVGGRSRGHVAGQKKKMAETVAGRASSQKTAGLFNGQ
ncbi:hypothetical protein BpHYR1_050297 [Brachionus plicatilis]|uniref:Uncharacterized protein n=1 Tax=Brachionus plicatilis TaxID=10195 RepID=A0A3M7R4N4_BRAPC|nr:hypothetical protein BpHYR1_050297 [Brachionus plicatilis]